MRRPTSFLFSSDHFNEGIRRDFYVSNSLHSLFSFFLFLEEFSFSTYISTITFCKDIFFDCRNIFTSNNFVPKSSLKRNGKQVFWNQCFQLFYCITPQIVGFVIMDYPSQRLNFLVIDKDIEFYEIICLISFKFIIHRSVSFCRRLKTIIKINNNLSHWQLIMPNNSCSIDIIHIF